MEKIVEKCPWRNVLEDKTSNHTPVYLCHYTHYCSGPNCAPAYWASEIARKQKNEIMTHVCSWIKVFMDNISVMQKDNK